MSLTIRRAQSSESALVASSAYQLAVFKELANDVDATTDSLKAAPFGDTPLEQLAEA
jgi:hypothetical protein